MAVTAVEMGGVEVAAARTVGVGIDKGHYSGEQRNWIVAEESQGS